jgi:hypothetical protein
MPRGKRALAEAETVEAEAGATPAPENARLNGVAEEREAGRGKPAKRRATNEEVAAAQGGEAEKAAAHDEQGGEFVPTPPQLRAMLDELEVEAQSRVAQLRQHAQSLSLSLKFSFRAAVAKLPLRIRQMSLATFCEKYSGNVHSVMEESAQKMQADLNHWVAETPRLRTARKADDPGGTQRRILRSAARTMARPERLEASAPAFAPAPAPRPAVEATPRAEPGARVQPRTLQRTTSRLAVDRVQHSAKRATRSAAAAASSGAGAVAAVAPPAAPATAQRPLTKPSATSSAAPAPVPAPAPAPAPATAARPRLKASKRQEELIAAKAAAVSSTAQSLLDDRDIRQLREVQRQMAELIAEI